MFMISPQIHNHAMSLIVAINDMITYSNMRFDKLILSKVLLKSHKQAKALNMVPESWLKTLVKSLKFAFRLHVSITESQIFFLILTHLKAQMVGETLMPKEAMAK